MLTITDINLSGLFSYGIHKTIHLDNMGLVLLGGANGSGKSSLFNALTTILYDQNPTGESGDAIVNETLGKCFGKVGFIDNNLTKWRVIYTRKWRKSDEYPDQEFNEASDILESGGRYSGTDVYLERWDTNKLKWIDERCTNQAGAARLDLKATRKRIIEILAINYQQFTSIGYLAQQKSLRFINGKHKERLEVLAELSDISIWDTRRDKIKGRVSSLEAEIQRANSIIFGAQQAGNILQEPDLATKAQLTKDIERIKQCICSCDLQLNKLYADKLDYTNKQKDIAKQINSVKAEQRELALQGSINNTKLAQEYKLFIEKQNTIRNRPHPKEYVILDTDIKQHKGYIAARSFDMQQLLPGAGKCPRCRSIVDDAHLLRQRELLSIEIKEHEATITDLQLKLDEQAKVYESNMIKDTQLLSDEYNITINRIKSDIEDINLADSLCQVKLRQLSEQNNALVDPHQMISQVEGERIRYLSDLANKEERIKDWDTSFNKWQQYSQSIEIHKNNILIYEDELKYLRVLERLFGDRGIKAHKLELVISKLNEAIKSFTDILTDESIHVWITPFREKNDGGTATDIQIMIRSQNKSDVPLNLYSGGERQLVVLALIGAFWKVASMQDSGVNILCLDEIFGPMDEYNCANTFMYLDYIRSQGKSSIIITTHNDNVKNQLNFDHKWTAIKTDGISTLITHESDIDYNNDIA